VAGPFRYVLMEVLSKHEVAQSVLDYFVHHKVSTASWVHSRLLSKVPVLPAMHPLCATLHSCALLLPITLGHEQDKLRRGLENYSEMQGKGFICWRFLLNETAQAKQAKLAQVQHDALGGAAGGGDDAAAATVDVDTLIDEVDV
jgi:hypothetical protein